jgi:hypothetical protein
MGYDWKGLVGAGWEVLGMGMMVRDGKDWTGQERTGWVRQDGNA